MTQFSRIGLDTSKAVFTVHAVDTAGQPVLRVNPALCSTRHSR